MIGKIKKGSGFKGCVNYVLGKEQAVLLHADGVLTESRGDIIRSFCMQTGMNPDLKKPVGHIALSYSAVDAPKLTDEKMVRLAQEYMREMKITDTQYIIVRHKARVWFSASCRPARYGTCRSCPKWSCRCCLTSRNTRFTRL